MKFYITILFLGFSLVSLAQKIKKDGKIYEVKKEKIFLNGEDVTDTLNIEKKYIILKEAATISEKTEINEKAKKKERKTRKGKRKRGQKARKISKKSRKRAKKS